MAPYRLFAIAAKEFHDHIRSRKFLLIFGILLIVAVVGMIGGVSEYNKNLDDYNKHQSAADSSPFSSYMPVRPSILSVFSSVATYLVFVGGILGIAMGFDLVSKEKESRSLKILLSHPVYRDEVINGKALGGIVALGCALGTVLAIALAVLLIDGIVPTGNEFVLIAVFAGVSFLFIFSYFAIALFMSTVSKDSGSALIYTIIIFILLSILVPTLANDTVMETIAGSHPELPQVLLDQMARPVNDTDGSMSVAFSIPEDNGAWEDYEERMQEYWQKRQMAEDTLALFSPTMNYQAITGTIASGNAGGAIMMATSGGIATASFDYRVPEEGTATDLCGMILTNIVALLLFPVVFFGLAYLKFMRLDVR